MNHLRLIGDAAEETKPEETKGSLLEINLNDKSEDYKSFEKLCENEARKKAKVRKHDIVFWATILGIIVCCFIVKTFFFAPISVIGASMTPTYLNGDVLLGKNVATFNEDICIGDVVVVKNEATDYQMFIKRVEGVPGDVVQIKDGLLYRNEEVINEGLPLMEDAGMFAEPVVLQENEYFVLGDNRNNSKDSRILGTFQYNELIYKITTKLFSKIF